jgi:hypothetical protein
MPHGVPRLRNLYRFRVGFVQSRERQVAENEVRFRALNERLEEQAGTWHGREGQLSVVCECGDEDCTAGIQLSVQEYEAVRAVETQFVLIRGHERAEVEDVVDGAENWFVVQKRGEAAEIAAGTDPRS